MIPYKPGWWVFLGSPRLVERKRGKLGFWYRGPHDQITWSDNLHSWAIRDEEGNTPPIWTSSYFVGPIKKDFIPPNLEPSYLVWAKDYLKQIEREGEQKRNFSILGKF